MADPNRKGRPANAYELGGDHPPNYVVQPSNPKPMGSGGVGSDAMTFGDELSMEPTHTGGTMPAMQNKYGEANLDENKGVPLPISGIPFGATYPASADSDSLAGGDSDGDDNDVGAAVARRSMK